MDPLAIGVAVLAAALVAVGFVAWQAAVGAGVIEAYRDRAADASPPLAVFVAPAADGVGALLVLRNRADVAVLRVVAWERRGLDHDPAPLASVERVEPGAAAEVPLAAPPTAPVCHVEWTPGHPTAVRRQADVPFLPLEASRA